ncbi:MAG: hypothetical protein HY040_28250 [Planctomycetes bacterium]|nr:hypothetical protein [Planctomycetota bacterium]
MASQAPPAPPPVTLSDDNPLHRVNLRLFQIRMIALAVIVTGCFFLMGVIPGIIALFIAKHFLVAVLAVGMRLPPCKN